MANSRLFEPLTVGRVELRHRMGMSPLTRYRASDEHVPLDLMATYYEQRASVPGTLLVSEATFISPQQGGYANVPGIYNDAQIEAWRKITKVVHAKGSHIFCQLWALGRTANPDVAKTENITITSSSDIPVSSAHAVPTSLTIEQIKSTIEDYAQAARNAIEAGFDGVELHGANGYLIDQFLQDKCNQRADEYGGSIENRSRFGVQAVQAVIDAIGADRTAIRLSPWSSFNSMRMDEPVPQFSDIIQKLDKLGLAYLHLVESRISGNADVEASDKLHFAYDIWNGPLLVAGGFRPDSARRLVDKEEKNRNIVVMFGRFFISTPDLPFRIRSGIELNEYNRDTFYTPKHPHGYIDYNFSDEFLSKG
ncbi:putative N-ethylmaleimide reductase [Eremomyces bilateralis CBS 781.70]|uniref:N-ethylmaleimide reductase n=1 Tax=Eremomyces bilateralis CBS 781.70 TaxID=1392243 RepID=A0A6G1GHB6_9PEZI|nr:putative N-ethylmaleimide reductase [Eremomyces bilateralis CBS 781.70]KAF1817468.1 putative N-ethylmaleimide reductase [Eremomyces bilateralis CBS 781.70]